MKKLINIFHSLPAWLSLRSAPAKPQAVSGAIRRDGAKPRSGTLSLFIIQNLFFMFTLFALVVKTIGITDISDIFTNSIYFKVYGIITLTYVLLQYILTLFLIRKYRDKTVNIPLALPNFIKDWLNEVITIAHSKNEALIKTNIKDLYVEISIYLTILILIIILL